MRPSEAAARQLIAMWGERAPDVVSDVLKAFPDGSLTWRAIEAYCGVFRPTPVEQGNEALQRMEGRREVYTFLRAVLSLSPSEVEQLLGTQTGEDDDA